MTTSNRGFRVAVLALLGGVFAALGSSATPEPTPTAKRTATPKSGEPTAAAPVVVDYKISVEGMDSIPPSSSLELKTDNCQASIVGSMNVKGEGKFRSLPTCVVRLKIFITGEPFHNALIEVSKYKGSPVLIEITPSSQEAKVTYPDKSS